MAANSDIAFKRLPVNEAWEEAEQKRKAEQAAERKREAQEQEQK